MKIEHRTTFVFSEGTDPLQAEAKEGENFVCFTGDYIKEAMRFFFARHTAKDLREVKEKINDGLDTLIDHLERAQKKS